MSSGSTPTLIFFLTLEQRLPEFFFQAANMFNSLGVSLVPVNIMELNEIKKGEQNISVLVYTASLSQLTKFYRLRQKNLDMAMRTGKFTLFHLSSFSRILELERMQRVGTYRPYYLPLSIRDICQQITYELRKRTEKIERWPGGRRAKLPFSSLT
jgi:hypothetical protein